MGMGTSSSATAKPGLDHGATPSRRLYPLRFAPILKSLIWGGRRLGSVLGKPLGEGSQYAESWELADHRDDVSQVVEGPLAGTTLRALIHDRGAALFGPALGARTQFPLLVKFLDANDVLSVQVHPDDALGRRLVDDNGKTEAWVIVHAEPGSLLYTGLKPGVTAEVFSTAIASGTVEPLLHQVHPKPGDCIMIPAGTVHAIGAGIVLAEVQQMSDATFRVFDWGRVGPDGRPRALHVAEALEATDFERGPVNPVEPGTEPIPGGFRDRLTRCPYFELERLRLTGPSRVGTPERFTILLGLGGVADICHEGVRYPIHLGETLLLPAEVGPCEVLPRGNATLLTCIVP